MLQFVALVGTLLITAPNTILGFVMPPTQGHLTTGSSATSLHFVDPSVAGLDLLDSVQSLWIATIDSDIANIPENEFAKVFAGGIGVMFGSLVSAMIVGAILEKGDLYAKLAAESYIQSEDDPEFWKNLSEDEKEKAKIMLSKIKEAKEGGIQDQTELKEAVMSAIEANDTTAATAAALSPKPKAKVQEAAKASDDMFSDYD